MNYQVHLKSPKWQQQGEKKLQLRGTCSGTLGKLYEAEDVSSIKKELKQLNGFYALVWEHQNQIHAAVDHVRSLPLFYAAKDNEFFLSDDAEWVRVKIGNTEMNEIAKEEFQLAGYVTGQDTLYPDVKQLQAGEFLTVNKRNDKLAVKTERYYRFLHNEPVNFNERDLLQQLDHAALESIDNLVRYANGRQIVIPLSGGYDSRLIATLLKRRGYENILCFTYGVPGNKESKYSKKVADALGLEWYFVEYSNEIWQEAWQTEERWQYQKWGSGWSSIPHVQDWLAVKILRNRNIVQYDCVFVPGHTGDFIAGGHIPECAVKGATADSGLLAESILLKHYKLAPADLVTSRKKLFWTQRVLDRAEHGEVNSGEDLANYFEKWEWQERQAKFICNSVRVYEFYGYDWWLPLWDMDFVKFWQSIPLELRKRRCFYCGFVNELYNKISESEENIGNASTSKIRILKDMVKSTFPQSLVSMIRWFSIRNKSVSGRFPREGVKSLTANNYTTNGILVYYFLMEVNGE